MFEDVLKKALKDEETTRYHFAAHLQLTMRKSISFGLNPVLAISFSTHWNMVSSAVARAAADGGEEMRCAHTR